MLLMTLSYWLPVRGDEHDRHAFVDQRDRPVLHLGGGHALGVDVADFLELQRAFERDRDSDTRGRGTASSRGRQNFSAMSRICVALLEHASRSARGSLHSAVDHLLALAWLMNLRRPRKSASIVSTTHWQVKALVMATPISGPACR